LASGTFFVDLAAANCLLPRWFLPDWVPPTLGAGVMTGSAARSGLVKFHAGTDEVSETIQARATIGTAHPNRERAILSSFAGALFDNAENRSHLLCLAILLVGVVPVPLHYLFINPWKTTWSASALEPLGRVAWKRINLFGPVIIP
jgi:hypothetical protein